MPQQVRQPTRIVRVRLVPCDCLHLLRIGQHNLQPILRIILQNIQRGFPIRARALHHDVGTTLAFEPLS